MSADWTFLTKFIIVGEQSVGKSAILIRLTEQRFLHNTEATIGVEFGSHLLTLDNGDRIKIQVWDTAGSEAFRSITRSYYRGAAGALLVFSLVHRPSFLHVQEWLNDVREHAEESVSIVLVGNMADLAEQPLAAEEAEETQENGSGNGEVPAAASGSRSAASQKQKKTRQVTREEAEAFAKKEGLIYVETSAKTGQNVEEAFSRAAREVHRKFLAAQAANAQDGATASSSISGAARPAGSSGSGGAAGFLRTRNGPGRGGGGDAGPAGSGDTGRQSGIDLGAVSGSAKNGCCLIQ
ncbi:hypothetical protein OC835_004470 [Tilletia horrida]|nr:hypothetical protein OC835_004470 [Tilletia horrida]